MNPSVHVEKVDAVTVVTLDRAQVRNAVDKDTAQALYEAFVSFDEDAQARVAVFHGANGHFCAGWDLQYGARMAQQAGGAGVLSDLDFEAADARPPGPMGPSRLLLSKPVIAAVSGAAVAGGMELALWCDLRLMEEDAYFGVYCCRFGVPLIDGGTVRLPRLVGHSRALDMILTGRGVDANEALAMGLANRVVPKGEARQRAEELAAELAKLPQQCMRLDRLSMLNQWGMAEAEAMDFEFGTLSKVAAESLEGAQRFAAGAGRHGAGA
jgi:enoyl-CoA hydratase